MKKILTVVLALTFGFIMMYASATPAYSRPVENAPNPEIEKNWVRFNQTAWLAQQGTTFCLELDAVEQYISLLKTAASGQGPHAILKFSAEEWLPPLEAYRKNISEGLEKINELISRVMKENVTNEEILAEIGLKGKYPDKNLQAKVKNILEEMQKRAPDLRP